MAMEKRQQQIEVGAGLTESRYSQDFIDLLKNWGGPVLFVVAMGVLGIQGYRWWTARQQAAEVTAIQEFEAARTAGNPTNLIRLADEHEGQLSVSTMARLTAADILLDSSYSGLVPGAPVEPDGTPKSKEDVLSEAQIAQKLSEAKGLYERVWKETNAVKGKELFAIASAFGLAAVAETGKSWDEARTNYDRVISIAERSGMSVPLNVAKERIAALETLKTAAGLPSEANVVTKWGYDFEPSPLAPKGVETPAKP